MSLFFSHTMSGLGLPVALTFISSLEPSFMLTFFSFSTNAGLTWCSTAERERSRFRQFGLEYLFMTDKIACFHFNTTLVLPSTVKVTDIVDFPALFWATTVHSPESLGDAGTMISD